MEILEQNSKLHLGYVEVLDTDTTYFNWVIIELLEQNNTLYHGDSEVDDEPPVVV